jgi:adenine-specific DNA methylase
MLMALLLPDPCDEHCPQQFKADARRLLKPMPMVGATATDEQLRKALLKFIADFAKWENSANPTYLECARGLVRAAHGEDPPLVVDPFAGGGSIPLEALRIGCDAFASDLNPVACLILKVLLEDIPRHGPSLADELRRVGKEIKELAEKELAEFYPPDPDGARPIAYLWARTVRCEAPKCGAEIPLLRSFWLCKKASRKQALRPKVVRPKEGAPQIEFETFEPKSDRDVPAGTVARAKATCLACGTVLSPDRVRAQLSAQRGGSDVIFDDKSQRVGGARLLAVVTLSNEHRGRSYRVACGSDYHPIGRALTNLRTSRLQPGLTTIPDEPLPLGYSQAFPITTWGPKTWGDLTNVRQKLTLLTFAQLVRDQAQTNNRENEWVAEMLSQLFSKFVEMVSSNCPWEPVAECPRKVFSMQALPARWEFAEGNVLADSSGSWAMMVENLLATLEAIGYDWRAGNVQQGDACDSSLPDESAHLWFTDPPYYDAVPYADLSDFFFVWLKRCLPGHPLLRDPDNPSNPLTPKVRELAVYKNADLKDRPPKDKSFFEEGMARAFAVGQRVLKPNGLASVVFAHKTTEGWEAFLGAMQQSGWVILASWPIQTEQVNRPRAREAAALGSSVHLVCRPRPEDAGTGAWEEILRQLPNRIGEWMERLSGEGIRGADLVFSCIGPALELYSKFDRVVDAQDREIPLGGDPEATEAYKRGFLAYIWEIVGRTALQQVLGTAEARARNSAAGALEEDARLTALFLWALQSTDKGLTAEGAENGEEEQEEDDEEEAGKPKKGYTLIYDVVRRFAQPLGIHLENWEGRAIETKKGVVRLISVLEREEQIFGTSGTHAVARALERTGGRDPQYMLFPEEPERRPARGHQPRRSQAKEEAEALAPRREATTLDRVHAAMILQARGEATALRAMLQAETERSPDFLRLANALSALYPKDSEEKRLLDAMLLAVPR